MSFVPTQHVQHVIAHYYAHNELNTVSGAYLLFPGDLTMEGFRLFFYDIDSDNKHSG